MSLLAHGKTLLQRACVACPPLADLYYCFSGAFRHEHRTALAGRIAHRRARQRARDAASTDALFYTLRRNTHRLEKGLIMRPRRAVFASGYIGETVDCFARLFHDADLGVERLRLQHDWSRAVLDAYFAAVDGTDPQIDAERAAYRAALGTGAAAPIEGHIPSARGIAEPVVDIATFEAMAWRRRSVRWYQQRPVERALVERALLAAALAPSACNRQPFRFAAYDDPATIRIIAGITGGGKGFHEQIPGLLVVVGQLRACAAERDRHVPYIDAALASMGMCFAMEAQGLGTCCMNWPNSPSNERAIRRLVPLAVDEVVIMLIAYGHPDPAGLVPYSQKKG
ncbi:MAG: nitroreductase family protein, partial [Planctomycetota bacterium]